MNRKTTAFRLSPEERKFLARHGRALVDQLRRDLELVRRIEGAVALGVGDHVDLVGLLRVLGVDGPDGQ